MDTAGLRGSWRQSRWRRVVRVAVFYGLLAAILVHVGELLLAGPWAEGLLLALAVLGFPVALALAWGYEMTPRGVRRDAAGNIEALTGIEVFPEGAPSLAVLPFEDCSEKGDQAFICKGLAEEILNALATVPGLRVVSRIASFQLSGQLADIRAAGRALAVQAVLGGSLGRADGRIQLAVRLVRTADGAGLWSQSCQGDVQDLFAIRRKIEDSVAGSLGVSTPSRSARHQQPANPQAYLLFLRGLDYFARHSFQDNVYARQMFKQALELEPGFGRAWAGVAYTHGFGYMYFNASDVNLAEARSTSGMALKLAPGLAASHVSSGIAHCMSRAYRKAGAEFEKAIRLDPMSYDAWYFYGRAKVQQGDLERALKLFERASRVRPEDYQSVLLQAQLYISLGLQDQALAVTRTGLQRVREMLGLNPADNRALNMGAFALLRLGEKDEAVKWMSESLRNAPMDSIIQYNGACFFSVAGDIERALDCLENCLIKVGNINREWLEHDSDMDNLRDHPRYQAIVSSFPG